MADQKDQSGQKRALIIGISDYADPSLETLDFCKNDGMGIYEVLGDPKYNFTENNKLVGRVNGNDLRETINNFYRERTPDNSRIIQPEDTLLFYYSGHGVLDADGDVYLASSDIDPLEKI